MIIGIEMKHEVQLLLREKVIKELDNVLGDLPLQNNYESVLDLGISKGTTNWQVYGSCKPHNERYQLVLYYDIFVNEDGVIEREEYDIENPPQNFILNLLPLPYKKIDPENRYLQKDENPPKIEITFGRLLGSTVIFSSKGRRFACIVTNEVYA